MPAPPKAALAAPPLFAAKAGAPQPAKAPPPPLTASADPPPPPPPWTDDRATVLARRSRSGSARGGYRNPEADRRRGSGDIGPPPPRSGADAFGPTDQHALNHERRRRAASSGLGREGANHFAFHDVGGRRRRFGPRDLCVQMWPLLLARLLCRPLLPDLPLFWRRSAQC